MNQWVVTNMNILSSKLTKRYLLITLVVVFFALSSIYWMTIQVMNSSIEEQIEYRDDLIAINIGKRIDSMIKKMINDTRIVSGYILKDSKKDKRFYIAEMERMMAYDPLYLFVQAYDHNGNELLRIPDVPFANTLSFNEIRDRLAWSKTYYISNMITLQDGRKTIAVAYPAIDADGEYQGGIIAYINLNILSDYLNDLQIGDQGINAVINREGFIIGHSNAEFIGVSLTDHVIRNYLYKERYGTWKGEIFGQNMMVSYKPLSLGGLSLIVGEPVQQVMASSRNVKLLLFKGFIIVLFITIALTFMGTSRVVKPILALIRQAKEYKENKRTKFVKINTKDELEDLSMTMGQMATELTDKERRLFYILESIPYCVITTDEHGKITTFNKGAEKLTLFKREEVIGRYIIDLPLKENKEEFISRKTLREGKAFDEVESYILDKNKKQHDVKLYSSLFRREDNDLVGAIIVIRDVSDIKKLEEYAKQSERLASLGQLTAGIAHEIKNPLSIIQAAAEAIHLELMDSQLENRLINELADDILESSDRMNYLLTDFLKLSKGEDDGTKEAHNLVNILDELLHLLRKTINDQEITIDRHYEVDEAFIYTNKNRITQVFLNILINSIQAMDQGGHLSVRIKDQQNDWEVEIEDTGKGISPSKLKWIFNPFFSTKREGTGLGLSISHEIIIEHNGKIRAQSTEGQGTILFVQISKINGRGIVNEKHIISR
jgi:PAS domain S-box-containing protein